MHLLPHMYLVFLLNYDLFCPNWSYQGQNYQNAPQIGPQWKIVTILFVLFYPFILYDPANTVRLFEKFLFEVEAFYSFKITCILVRHIISFKKNGGAISKICCLILWSPFCTPLTLVLPSVKMAVTSPTVICNSMRVDTPEELLI